MPPPVQLPSLTIADGQTDSGVLSFNDNLPAWVASLLIYAPAALGVGVTVLVAPPGGSTFYTLQSGGSDVALTAGDATPIIDIAFGKLMLKAATGVTGNQVFEISGREDKGR